MSVGILLITHDDIGGALLETARVTFGEELPLAAAAVHACRRDDPERVLEQARAAAAGVDSGDGVLVLTDLYGATPSNIALRLKQECRQMEVVSGLNLPMLLRTLNYADLDLVTLADYAVTGGRNGIFRA
ncbi:MAG: PTS sugar transporter subunit IIA [Gammaproteobacteria bacterium]|nr:MAG: PTS sugar transporter subunit IIA [Gammaproteobacteria bacterium]